MCYILLQVRVICGKEPPCFLNLYRGQMVVYSGKREESQDDDTSMFYFKFYFEHINPAQFIITYKYSLIIVNE